MLKRQVSLLSGPILSHISYRQPGVSMWSDQPQFEPFYSKYYNLCSIA